MIIVIIESRLIEWKRREPLHIMLYLERWSESSKPTKIANTDDSGYLSLENGLRSESLARNYNNYNDYYFPGPPEKLACMMPAMWRAACNKYLLQEFFFERKIFFFTNNAFFLFPL